MLVKAGYKPAVIIADPDELKTQTLKIRCAVGTSGRYRRSCARSGTDPGSGIGATTFPAAGSPSDLALLLADHHGADLIVTAGCGGDLDDFFDRSRRESNPSTFLTRMKVGASSSTRKPLQRCTVAGFPGYRDRFRRAGCAHRDHRRGRPVQLGLTPGTGSWLSGIGW